MGGLGLINPSDSADAEYPASIWVSAPLVCKIEAQSHETSEKAEVQRLVYATRKEKDDGLREELEEVKAMLPDKTQRAVDPVCEKGASNWLTVIPLKDMDFDLNKREFRDAVRLRYYWPIPDNPSVCFCGSMFTVDHAMICQRGGSVIHRHNEIRDLQASDSCRDRSPKQIYRIHKNEKKRKYNSRVTEIVSFAILQSALLCLRGSRTPRRRNLDVKDRDLEIEKGQAGLP